MALYRPPNHCPFCGELIKERHLDQSGIPFMFQKIGDNFLGYEHHTCDEEKKKEWQKEHPVIQPKDGGLDFSSLFSE